MTFQMMIMPLFFGHIDTDVDGVLTEAELTNHRPPRRDRQIFRIDKATVCSSFIYSLFFAFSVWGNILTVSQSYTHNGCQLSMF
jgi:hypothetical protein